MSECVVIPTGQGDMPAHLWLPQSGSGPGILLVQEIFGVSDYIERRAVDLAGLGYVVMAPEIYWRLGQGRVENGPQMLEEAFSLLQRLDWDTAVSDGLLALRALEQRDETTGEPGIVGFCFGGGLGFAISARHSPKALVSYYGSALPQLMGVADQVGCPQLHHFGLADSYIDADMVRQIEQAVAGPNTEFHTYPGADHAFDNADWSGHHPEASERAWQHTVHFLQRWLPVG